MSKSYNNNVFGNVHGSADGESQCDPESAKDKKKITGY